MMGVPREKPAIENLNSYYLVLDRMIEHYQGEFGAGCIHLRSNSAEGAVFFDPNAILGGVYRSKTACTRGLEAVNELIRAASTTNFSVDLYPLKTDLAALWAGTSDAEEIFRDLDTAFTDLDALIQKMHSERLTGYIDVRVDGGKESGILFLQNGEIVTGSYTWIGHRSNNGNLALLLQKSKRSGAVFHVGRFRSPKAENKRPTSGTASTQRSGQPAAGMRAAVKMIERLLNDMQRTVSADKDIQVPFETLLKRKFIQKAGRHGFLDPFADEFTYEEGKVAFSGDASARDLVDAVLESVRELSGELEQGRSLDAALTAWAQTHAGHLAALDLRV